MAALAAALAASPAVPVQAQGQSAQERAESLSATAKARYELGAYDEAIVLWEQAYREYADPTYLFNLGQAHRQLKNHEKASFYYRAYLRNAPNASNREDVEELILELDELLEAEKAARKKPPVGVGGQGGQPVAPPPEQERWYQDGWGWALVGAGVVIAGAGGYLVWKAGDLENDPDFSLDQSLQDDAALYDLAGVISLVAGGLLIVGGGAKLAWTDAQGETQPAMVVGWGWLGLRGTF